MAHIDTTAAKAMYKLIDDVEPVDVVKRLRQYFALAEEIVDPEVEAIIRSMKCENKSHTVMIASTPLGVVRDQSKWMAYNFGTHNEIPKTVLGIPFALNPFLPDGYFYLADSKTGEVLKVFKKEDSE